MRVRLPAFVSCDVGRKTNMREPPQDDDELYTARELEELDELNRLGDDHTSFFQSRWWKRGAIAFAMLIVLSLLLPILLIVQSGSSGQTGSARGTAGARFRIGRRPGRNRAPLRRTERQQRGSARVLPRVLLRDMPKPTRRVGEGVPGDTRRGSGVARHQRRQPKRRSPDAGAHRSHVPRPRGP